jgi:hypothetical protein
MTDTIMSDTQDSTRNQYVVHTGVVPFSVSAVSVNEPTSRINAQMIITVERPSNVTMDSFRAKDIIDLFTMIMGKLTTRQRQYSSSCLELSAHITY